MKLLLSIIFLSLPLLIFSQEDIDTYEDEEVLNRKLWLLEFNLELDKPINAFGRNLNNDAKFGLSFSVLRERKINGPIFLGGSFYTLFLGSRATEYVDNTTLEDISDRAASVGLGFDFTLRYYPDFYYGPFEPFFEAVIGPRFFYSYTSTTSLNTGENIGFDINSWDSSLAYGVGAGVHTTIYEAYGMNLKVLFHPGFIANYLVRQDDNTIVSDNPLDFFRSASSSTDMFRFQWGFVAVF